MKVEPSVVERSVISMSTDFSLARRMDASLDAGFPRNNHPSMFDQAFMHNRDIQ